MSTKKLIGIMGSIILYIGVFTPIVSVSIMDMNMGINYSMNYFQNGKADGIIVLVLAGISLILVLTEKFKGLWLTGLGSIGAILYTFINFQTKMSQTNADKESQLLGNSFPGLTDLATQAVQLEGGWAMQLQWGWAVLILGAALVIAAAAVKEETK